MVRGEEPATQTWEAAVEAVHRALTPGCHVVCLGGSGTSAIEAVSRDGNRVCSLIFEGLVLSEATLLAAGADSLAALVPLLLPTEKGWVSQVGRMILGGGGDDLVNRFAECVLEDLDWELTRKLSLSWSGWNLLADPPTITVPTLFLTAGLPIAGYDETLNILRRLVPGVEVETLELWPSQNHLPAAGVEMAGRLTAFLETISARG